MNNKSNNTMSKNQLDKKTVVDMFAELDYDPTPSEHKDKSFSVDEIFKLISLYFRQPNILYSHQHNSFDKFIDEDIHNLLERENHTFYEQHEDDNIHRFKLKFENVSMKPAKLDNEDELMFPSDSRKRSLTYAGKLLATVTQVHEIEDMNSGKIEEFTLGQPEYEVPIATIPIMVRSKYCSLNIKKGYDKSECEHDPGGYFIINGSEKVIVPQERLMENKPHVFVKKDGMSKIYSVQVNSKSYTTNTMPQVVMVEMDKNKQMTIKIPILHPVPVFIVMRALGIESAEQIVALCTHDLENNEMVDLVRHSLENTYTSVMTGDSEKESRGAQILKREEPINYLITKLKIKRRFTETDKTTKAEQKKMLLMNLLQNNFLPHIEGSITKKAYYLGYMINKLLRRVVETQDFKGDPKKISDDRDSYVNKRIDLAGSLLMDLFKQNFKKLMNKCYNFFKKSKKNLKRPPIIINQLDPTTIEQGLKNALLTGNWGKAKGVAQMLQRMTYLYTMSSLRRLYSPMGDASTNKLTGPRHLHAAQIGFVCLTGDTMILLADGSTKKICDLTSNDKVITFNKTTFCVEETEIYNLFSKESNRIIKITTCLGKVIKADHMHPFFTTLGSNGECMIKAKDLEVGNSLITWNGHMAIIDDIGSIEDCEIETVYDFTTFSSNHTFIANGFVVSNCYIETPEGAKVGIVKNLSLMGNVTVMKNSMLYILKGILMKMVDDIGDGMKMDGSRLKLGKYTKIFLNGDWIGITREPLKLYHEIRNMKLENKIDPLVSIVHDVDDNEIRVNCEGGRLFRPVLVVKDNKLKLKREMIERIALEEPSGATMIKNWDEFMLKNSGVIEYIDAEEQNQYLIAMKHSNLEEMRKRQHESIDIIKDYGDEIIDPYKVLNRYDNTTFMRYTHCEFHPTMLLGIVGSIIPYCNRNQGPRNIYQYSQARQAMGIYATNYRDRLDITYILYHPMKPLINTRLMQFANTDVLPMGENAIVAIQCYTGYNQEDSVILNQTAIDRGLFRSENLKKYFATIQKNQSTTEDDMFVKPDPELVTGMNESSYEKLNEQGFVPEETEIYNGDVILGKVTPINNTGMTTSNKKYKDSSEVYKSYVSGVVDKVYTNIYNSEGFEVRKMRVRSMRIPHIGDKFCSRHGQKGTCGITLPSADMPFTKNGIQPDIIMNPNAIPSRMTIGQLLEGIVGKMSALRGHETDGTAFNNLDIKYVQSELERLGYEKNGYEYLYNGMTGRRLKHDIFIVPTYYQRLKHMVSDKIHGRSRGPRTLLTRQPPIGRTRDGGLRFGEMERDCIIAHGMGVFLKERMLDCSDPYVTYVCGNCGFFAERKKTKNTTATEHDIYHCRMPECHNSKIYKVRIPYAFKLLIQDLQAMCIAPRIRFKDNL
jgi:DNA-directed RNA polymerase beta subunit